VRYVTLRETLELHRRVMAVAASVPSVRDLGALESALAQPRMTFGSEDLYPDVIEKACALGFSMIQNHPFVDGNKRTGHLVMELFLIRNGLEIQASDDEQEQIILQLAAGELGREEFCRWLRAHTTPHGHLAR
jgi:death on curing protein